MPRCWHKSRQQRLLAAGSLLLPFAVVFGGASAPAAADAKAAQGATAVAFKALPFTALHTTFANGLQAVCVPWPGQTAVAYYTLVNVGSRNEITAGRSGFAHLFEHMMFRGTRQFPGGAFEEQMQRLGADSNAYTTRDYTLYTDTVPKQALTQLITLEADRFQNLDYSESVFRTETGAVLGEYYKSIAHPLELMWERLSGMAYQVHPYGHTTLGYLRDIQQMPDLYRYSQEFFRRYYVPTNTVIFVVGDVDPATVFEHIARAYGDWRGEDLPFEEVPQESPPLMGAREHISWKTSSPRRILMGYRATGLDATAADRSDAQQMRDVAALEVVHALAFGPTSPLVERLVLKQRKLLELSSWAGFFSRDPGLFVVEMSLAPEVDDFQTLVEEVQAFLDQAASSDGPPLRLSPTKSHLYHSLLASVQRPDDVADLLASFQAWTGSFAALNSYLEQLEQLDAAAVKNVIRRYLKPQRRFVVTLATGS